MLRAELFRFLISPPQAIDNHPHLQAFTTRSILRLICMEVGLFVTMILVVWGLDLIELQPEMLYILAALAGIFSIIWILSQHYNCWRLVSPAAPLVFFIIGLYGTLIQPSTSSLVLSYAVAILLSSALHGLRATRWLTVVSIACIFFIRLLQFNFATPVFLPATLITGSVLGCITLLQEFVVSQYQQSIRQVEQTAEQLQHEVREREKTELSLRRERDLISKVMETSPCGIIMLDPQGKITYANSLALRTLGMTREEIVRRTYFSPEWAITSPDGEPVSICDLPFVRVIATHQSVYGIRQAVCRPDGQRIQLLLNAAPLSDEDGKLTGVITTVQDITDQEKSTQALRSSEERLRTVVSNAPLVLWSVDSQGKFTFSDGVGLKKLNLVPGQVVGQSVFDLYRAQADITGPIRRALLGEPTRAISQISDFTFDTHFAPLVNAAGQVEGVIGVSLDVTEQRRAEDETALQFRRISALHQIDQAIINGFDIDNTLKVLLNQITTHLAVDAANIILVDANGRSPRRAASTGFRITPGNQFAAAGRYTQSIISSREQVMVLSLTSHRSEWLTENPNWTAEMFSSYIGVPLIAKNQVKGVLELFSRKPLQPEQEWLNFLKILAGQAAIAIDNATLFADLQRSHHELAQAYDLTLGGWARVLEMRDEETEGHSQRVVQLTEMLGRQMGLEGNDLLHLRRGAQLHDIGKMAIPDGILTKPGPLSEVEWKIMRMHPVYAFQMLSAIPFLHDSLDVPFCHHERWDGTGYPRGLKGEEIPLPARIFAVVDVWDALHADRPYRKAWPEEKILDYLRTQSGQDFDPQVVEIFIKMMAIS